MMLDLTIWRWQRRILAQARKKLGRPLRDYEKTFVTSRHGCIALEMIDDTVRTAERDALEAYLGKERIGGKEGNKVNEGDL